MEFDQNIFLKENYFIVGIIASFLLSFIPFITFRFTQKQTSMDENFEFTILLTTPIVFSIMFFIGTNIALSIGLVGSLSIVRFRTAIKSPKELIYILWSIAAGVGLGSNNLEYSAIASLVIGFFIIVLEKLLFKSNGYSSNTFIVKLNQKRTEEFLNIESIKKHFQITSISQNSQTEETVIAANLIKKYTTKREDLFLELQKNESISQVQFIES